MHIDQTLLSTILSMKKLIEEKNEPNGKYSINRFITTGEIEYASDSNDDLFVHDTKRGDHATRHGHFVPNVRNVIWAERIADKETNQPAITTGLTPMINAGDCVCLLKDISENPDQTHYVPDSYVMIPEGHLAFAQPANNQGIGYVVVVEELK